VGGDGRGTGVLAAYCVRVGYMGALPWLTAMVGLPWTAHGTVCAFYLNMSKSNHKGGGITFVTARAAGFQKSGNSPVQGFRLHGAVLRFWVCCTYSPSYAWTGQQQMA